MLDSLIVTNIIKNNKLMCQIIKYDDIIRKRLMVGRFDNFAFVQDNGRE